MTSVNELTARRLPLPALLVGFLPTTAQAQHMSAELNEDLIPDRVAEPVRGWLADRG